jgi:predicted nucleic acid-binding protein
VTTFVDTSVFVATVLRTESLSAKAQKELDEMEDEDPAIDTTIALETFLVLRSKIGAPRAAEEVARILDSYAYFTVPKGVLGRALPIAHSAKMGDAVITEHVKALRARLLTLDEKQAALCPDNAILIR